MRSATWCLLAILMAAGVQVNAETVSEGGAVQPLHQPGAASQIADLQLRLKDSEQQREELTRQLQNADPERNNALLTRLRQENQSSSCSSKKHCPQRPASADRAATMVHRRRRRCDVRPSVRYIGQRLA